MGSLTFLRTAVPRNRFPFVVFVVFEFQQFCWTHYAFLRQNGSSAVTCLTVAPWAIARALRSVM